MDLYEGLPHRDIEMDWGAFQNLDLNEKKKFLELAESIEKGGWFNHENYGTSDWAVVDLSEYADYSEFERQLKKAGSSFYEGRKAEKRGYYTKFFEESTFIGDIVTIDGSAPERQGKAMFESFLIPVEGRGGYPTQYRHPEVPQQGVFWLRKFGTFRAAPGRRQGSVVVDEELVSYLSLRCFANFVNYNLLLGHDKYLRDGIVHKMHLDFIKAILEARNQAIAGASDFDRSLAGVRFIGYGSLIGTSEGLRRWKKSNLFKPVLFKFDYTPALTYLNVAA